MATGRYRYFFGVGAAALVAAAGAGAGALVTAAGAGAGALAGAAGAALPGAVPAAGAAAGAAAAARIGAGATRGPEKPIGTLESPSEVSASAPMVKLHSEASWVQAVGTSAAQIPAAR